MLLLVVTMTSANNTAGAIYGLRLQIQFSGSGTFMRNKAGMDYGRNCNGTAMHVEFSSISLSGYFKFIHNHIITDKVYQIAGGTIAVSHSSLTLQGAIFFHNNLNLFGAAILLSHSECLISGHAVFEGNKAFTDGGAIDATPSSLIIKSNEFYLHNNSEYINSECFSKSYSQSILFCNNSAGGWGGAVELEDSNMSLTGSVVFMANEASDGGGIDITYTTDLKKCSPNYIIFEEPLDLIFHANLATRSGGAL